MSRIRLVSLLVVLALVAAPGLAHDGAAVDNSGWAGAFVNDFDRATGKILQLADAMSAEQYGWSPMEGVRTTSQNFMHIAAANFHLAAAVGANLPDGLPEDLEAVTDKDEVKKYLEQSFAAVKEAVEMNKGKDLDTVEIEVFGMNLSRRGVFAIITGHNHEHLGQAIAYARSNQVVPPWSQ